MSDTNKGYDIDVVVVAGLLLVFGLPLTLLVPDFSVWDVIPKIEIIRCHIVILHLTWPQNNIILIVLLTVFFCIYLEIKKRKLDDMVEKVLAISQAADTTMVAERERQSAAMKDCVKLLDASTEHYEDLILLKDELRKRDKVKLQHPPTIEPSTSYF